MKKKNSLLSTGYTSLNSLPFQGKEAAKGFTLVELIVVITILAILGTIAFISLQGYSKDARDSVRISDISKIKTSLELFQLDAGKYPETTDATNITYSGAIAWTQGIFGMATFNNVTKLDKIPTDPVTDRKYVYSVTNTKQEYQLAGVMEGDEVTMNLNQPNPNINQPHPSPLLRGEGIDGILETNAAGKTAMLKISGNYNGKILKVNTGGIDYVLAVPSIITSSGTTVDQIISSKFLAYNGYKNLPAQYAGSSYEILGDDGINLVNSDDLIVYSGNLKTLSSSEQVGKDARKDLITKLQNAYNGTAITNVGEIAQIINTDTEDETTTEFLSTTIVNNNLGGSIAVSSGGGSGTQTDSCATQPSYTHATFTIGTPTSVNQEYVKDATNCGYTCTDGYTGLECDLAPGQLISKSTCELANWVWVDGTLDNQGDGFCISPRIESNADTFGIAWQDVGTTYGWTTINYSTVEGLANNLYGVSAYLNPSYTCDNFGVIGVTDFIGSDTIVGRMKWLATFSNASNNETALSAIDWINITTNKPTYSIPSIYIADCIDGVKDLTTNMALGAETITWSDYISTVDGDDSINDITRNNRNKYLLAWTNKKGSHLPSAYSDIGSQIGDNLTTTSRGEYQVACEAGKFGTYSVVNQASINDQEAQERIWLSAVGRTTGTTRGSYARIIGYTGCGSQNTTSAGNRSSTYSARFVVRP